MDTVRDAPLMLQNFLNQGAGIHHQLPLTVYMGLKAASKTNNFGSDVPGKKSIGSGESFMLVKHY
jgi:hypothetical protein